MEDKWAKDLGGGRVATYTIAETPEATRKRYGNLSEPWMHDTTETIEGDAAPVEPITFFGPPEREAVELAFKGKRHDREEFRLKKEARQLECRREKEAAHTEK